jgi:hypothetical protein
MMRKANGSTGGKPMRINYDTPTAHGWTIRRTDDDGLPIWELAECGEVIAVMKSYSVNIYNVAIMTDGEPEWFEVTLGREGFAGLTEQVKRLASAFEDDRIFASGIDWDCGEDYEAEDSASPLEMYGLMRA